MPLLLALLLLEGEKVSKSLVRGCETSVLLSASAVTNCASSPRLRGIAVALQRLEQGLTVCRDASRLPAAAEAAAPPPAALLYARRQRRGCGRNLANGARARPARDRGLPATGQCGWGGERRSTPLSPRPSLLKDCAALYCDAHDHTCCCNLPTIRGYMSSVTSELQSATLPIRQVGSGQFRFRALRLPLQEVHVCV